MKDLISRAIACQCIFMYMYSPVAIVRVYIRSVSTDVAVDIHLLISAKPKLQYYAGAVSQVSHVLAK